MIVLVWLLDLTFNFSLNVVNSVLIQCVIQVCLLLLEEHLLQRVAVETLPWAMPRVQITDTARSEILHDRLTRQSLTKDGGGAQPGRIFIRGELVNRLHMAFCPGLTVIQVGLNSPACSRLLHRL